MNGNIYFFNPWRNGDIHVSRTYIIDALEIGGWRDGLDGIEDYDFWLRLIRRDKKFINIQEKLVLHRLHNNSNFNTKKYNLTKI